MDANEAKDYRIVREFYTGYRDYLVQCKTPAKAKKAVIDQEDIQALIHNSITVVDTSKLEVLELKPVDLTDRQVNLAAADIRDVIENPIGPTFQGSLSKKRG